MVVSQGTLHKSQKNVGSMSGSQHGSTNNVLSSFRDKNASLKKKKDHLKLFEKKMT